MSLKNKVHRKGIAVWYLLFSFLLAIGLPVNIYAGPVPVSVTLYVDQVFIKNSSVPDINNVFSYNFISQNAENPMPSGSLGNVYSFTAAGTTVKEIGSVTFLSPGIYFYEIKGNAEAPAKGYSYDPQVYLVGIFVKETDGELTAETIVKKSDGSKAGTIKFENTYTPVASDPGIMPDPPVSKTVSNDPRRIGTFTFSLTAKDEANPMPEGSVDGVKNIIIYGSGEMSFGTWSYIREGTYYYTVSENKLSDIWFTYDDSVYTITDVVKEEDSQLVVYRTVTNGSNKQVESCIFINKYNGRKGDREESGSDVKDSGISSGISYISIEEPGNNNPENNSDSLDDMNVTGNSGNPDVPGNLGLSSPKTGDYSRYELYNALLIISAIVSVGCVIYLILPVIRRTAQGR